MRPGLLSPKSKAGGVSPAALIVVFAAELGGPTGAPLLALVGQYRRGHRDRLAARQRRAVRRFLVGVGWRQVRRTGLQHVDQVLREVLTDLHDRQIRTEDQSLRTKRAARSLQAADDGVDRIIVLLATGDAPVPRSGLTPDPRPSAAAFELVMLEKK